MGSSNNVYMKASVKQANITPLSLLRSFATLELTNKLLDAAFVAKRWPTKDLMGPRGYSKHHCQADQPVTRCILVAISGGHLMMKVSPAWVVTILLLVHMTVSRVCKGNSETRERKKNTKNATYFFVLPRRKRFSCCICSGNSLEGYFR